METVKTVFWALIIGLAAAFAYNNWFPVDLNLWSDLVAEVNLPLLMLVCFLIGFVPMLLVHYTSRWRMRQRISSLERTMNDLRTAHAAPNVSNAPAPPKSDVDTSIAPAGDGPLFESLPAGSAKDR